MKMDSNTEIEYARYLLKYSKSLDSDILDSYIFTKMWRYEKIQKENKRLLEILNFLIENKSIKTLMIKKLVKY
jgi:hypothetical protein